MPQVPDKSGSVPAKWGKEKHRRAGMSRIKWLEHSIKSALLPFAILALLVTGPVACGPLQNHSAEYPLNPSRAGMYFPPSSQITATMRLSRQGANEDYLLALNTKVDTFEAVFLNPQGIPLSNIRYSDKKLHISNSRLSPRLLTTQLIMDYLELIYRNDVGVQEAILRPNWTFETNTQERRFKRSSVTEMPSEAGFTIRYHGEAPWYQVVDVVDRGREHIFSIRILGGDNAIPE